MMGHKNSLPLAARRYAQLRRNVIIISETPEVDGLSLS
jgi:hypothetical protein